VAEQQEVIIMRVPISLPCVVPVDPETGRAMDDEGEPLPIDQRPEKCCRDAWWFFEAAPMCDMHMRELMGAGIISGTYDELLEENGHQPNERELEPWPGYRYDQEEARFLGEGVGKRD
jgi:hypothetical protein